MCNGKRKIRSICERIFIACAFAMICVPAWGDRLQESFDARADSLAAVLDRRTRRTRQRSRLSGIAARGESAIFNRLLATTQSRSTGILLRVSQWASLPDGIRRFF